MTDIHDMQVEWSRYWVSLANWPDACENRRWSQMGC